MIELQALSLGYAVPQHDFDCTVHSVFPEAINLTFGNRARLLTLVTSGCADLPQGISLDTPAGFSLDMGLQRGDRLISRKSLLQDDCVRLSIDLSRAKYWKCHLPNLKADGVTDRTVAAWSSVWKMLNEQQKQTGTDLCAEELFYTDFPMRNSVTKIMGNLIRELVKATQNYTTSVDKIVARLIGLGPGLTPSSDDFLVGFLTGLRCTTGKSIKRWKFFSQLGKDVIHLSGYTNDISRTYLFHAARGQVSRKLSDLVDAIAGGESTDHFWQTVEEALRVGHSSGMDSVTGLLVGLSAWGNGFPQIWSPQASV